MEFSLAIPEQLMSVCVPDALVDQMILLLDVPGGLLRLDPYRDSQITPDLFDRLRVNISLGIEERQAALRKALLRRFGKPQVEPWMVEPLRVAETADPMLEALRRLETLLELAQARRASIKVFGQ